MNQLSGKERGHRSVPFISAVVLAILLAVNSNASYVRGLVVACSSENYI